MVEVRSDRVTGLPGGHEPGLRPNRSHACLPVGDVSVNGGRDLLALSVINAGSAGSEQVLVS